MARRKLATKKTSKNKNTLMNDLSLELGIIPVLAGAGQVSITYAYHKFKLEQEAKGNSPKTIEFYDRFFKSFSEFYNVKYNYHTGKHDIDNHTTDTDSIRVIENTELVNRYIASLKSTGVNQQTINAYLRGYRAFGNYCLREGVIEVFKCHIKELEPPAKQVYTQSELKKLTAKPSIENFEEYRNFTIISLILATGARSNTIINLKIEDCDLEEGYITFNTTKAHKVVRIGLERKIKHDLAEYIVRWRRVDAEGQQIPTTDYLFCNTFGEQLTRGGLSTAIRRYNNRRGVDKTSIHLLRHTYAKNWITSGGDLISLAKVLTHSDLEMVKRYSNLYGEDVKAEIEQHSTLSQLRRASGQTIKTQNRK